jgi:nucleoside triphosphate diphosphatase
MTDSTKPPELLRLADKTQVTLNYAVNLQILAAQVGFDWPDINGVVDKIKEELDEVIAETNTPNNHERLHDEIGDLLFACTNLARHLNIDPERALQSGNQKFYRRFTTLESLLAANNIAISECDIDKLNSLWNKVKEDEK